MALTKISRGLLSTGISDSSDATAITIDSSENVGIGTTTPADKLEVAGNILISDGSPELTFETGASHYNWQIAAQENTSNAFEIAVGSADADASNDSFSSLMTILQSGNVGIGDTSPSEKLEVNGTVKATAFEGDGSSLTGVSGGISASSLSGNGYVKFSNGYTIQWGEITSTASAYSVTFPTAFTTLYSVVTTIIHSNNDTAGVSNADAITPRTSATATGFRVSHYQLYGFFWIATGKIT